TIVASLGMLETLWTSHLRVAAAETRAQGGAISNEHSRRVYDEHEHIQQLIAQGDVEAAVEAARRHIREARVHTWRPGELNAVKAATVRDFPQDPAPTELR